MYRRQGGIQLSNNDDNSFPFSKGNKSCMKTLITDDDHFRPLYFLGFMKCRPHKMLENQSEQSDGILSA